MIRLSCSSSLPSSKCV
ncbi:unnamed protein product [Darwinula stevensoni]|uniref:Uncharacterized protein n=1 Tax=Darwinula stevensoni TaxID=69355 RepID=A0A7R8X3X4_9CRUS|nr:unnamed protein product [Darwinula stevensoni]CAG0878554.1 unnamed protein product [Darwinula stevensoni]